MWTSYKKLDFMGFFRKSSTGKHSGDFWGLQKGNFLFHDSVENPPVEGVKFVDGIGEKVSHQNYRNLPC